MTCINRDTIIYHTETQADYDALMVELDKQGYEWTRGVSTTIGLHYWERRKYYTCVVVRKGRTLENYTLREVARIYPNTPIQKYKAKADDKMRFTKDSVGKLFSEHDKYICYSLNDLYEDILKLDDTPEKVPVPEYFDGWYQEIKSYWSKDSSAKSFALWKICQRGFGHSFEDVRGKKISRDSDLARWLRKNETLAIDAILNGYTIAPEQLYYIPLPDLETSDGLQQVLSKRINDKRYFASRPNDKLQQRFTKDEIAQVPEVYKFYAKPIEEEEEE